MKLINQFKSVMSFKSGCDIYGSEQLNDHLLLWIIDIVHTIV